MNKAIKKFSNVFGKNLAKAFLFTVKNNKNVQCDFNVELKINNMNFKMDRLFFDINETIPSYCADMLNSMANSLDVLYDFDYLEERNKTFERSDGFYADATVIEESFIFSFKLNHNNKTAVLLGTITPFSYYENLVNEVKEIYPLTIQLEFFDCVNDIEKKYKNNQLVSILIEQQDLKNFLINQKTKYEYREKYTKFKP